MEVPTQEVHPGGEQAPFNRHNRQSANLPGVTGSCTIGATVSVFAVLMDMHRRTPSMPLANADHQP